MQLMYTQILYIFAYLLTQKYLFKVYINIFYIQPIPPPLAFSTARHRCQADERRGTP